MKFSNLFILFLVCRILSLQHDFEYSHGALIRGDKTQKELAMVFTGDEFADGGNCIRSVLSSKGITASFFLTGNFYRNPDFKEIIAGLKKDGHYLGAHSDKHLLYCSWENRDSLLVNKEEFLSDLDSNYAVMRNFGIQKQGEQYFLPPYEWYNKKIAQWCNEAGLTLVNFTPGTRSHTDWTYPEIGKSYAATDAIFKSILDFEQKEKYGLNGFILLLHIGSDPRRQDKSHAKLPGLIDALTQKGYQFKRIDELLNRD